MERKALVVCCVTGFLGLLSAASSFGAEATRTKASQFQFDDQCMYHRSPTIALGLIAIVALLVSQLIIYVAIRFAYCRNGSEFSDSIIEWVAFVCYVLSWFATIVAYILLTYGIYLIRVRDEESAYSGHLNCPVVKPGMYGGGGILSLAIVAAGIVFYISLSKRQR